MKRTRPREWEFKLIHNPTRVPHVFHTWCKTKPLYHRLQVMVVAHLDMITWHSMNDGDGYEYKDPPYLHLHIAPIHEWNGHNMVLSLSFLYMTCGKVCSRLVQQNTRRLNTGLKLGIFLYWLANSMTLNCIYGLNSSYSPVEFTSAYHFTGLLGCGPNSARPKLGQSLNLGGHLVWNLWMSSLFSTLPEVKVLLPFALNVFLNFHVTESCELFYVYFLNAHIKLCLFFHSIWFKR